MCREKRLEYMVEIITGIDIDGVLQGGLSQTLLSRQIYGVRDFHDM